MPLQILFGLLYILNLGITLVIYLKTDVVWGFTYEMKVLI